MKGLHNFMQTSVKALKSLAALWASESQTAAQKRGQSQALSSAWMSSSYSSSGGGGSTKMSGGLRERMWMLWLRVYGEKWRWGTPA